MLFLTLQAKANLTEEVNQKEVFKNKFYKCTCVGCASGCSLSIFGSNCSCSACGYGGSQECKKTEEMTIKTLSGSSDVSFDTGN